ncbi:acetyl-CoA hydrolase/transferase family protein [Metabacillus arenae]|uniref:Acetyl-CoA hydrolase/transferase family protein n=1 Tax=Metabacillus arenae TaxID=2771434 RepID=A0A926NM41_9BACI|nr:acetyl-CoA hydrolase/transferase family protein [Metabacillus arenae]MBD1383605.1 acetyl-CoA hydrolase/transferase family protein [Metabacillus arenae]
MVNEWVKTYQDRQRTVEEAISLIQSKSKVILSSFCSEPQTLLEELVRQKDRLFDVTLYNNIIGSPCVYAAAECFPNLQIRTFLGSPLLKEAYQNRACDYIPINLSEIPRFIENANMDIAFIQVSPPNEKGYCNLGISVDFAHSLIQSAKCVIAEVNSQMPSTYGNTSVHVKDIDCFVLTSRPLLSIPQGTSTSHEQKIGEYVSELIPDQATIQVGLGSLADSIIRALSSKKGLGIHSGSITDAVIDLVEKGVITNEHKEIDRCKMVCTTLTGTERLYRFAHMNPLIELHPVSYTHNGSTHAKLARFHSINSALEVDLTGQINAEQVGPFPLAGVGGQMDFIRGAGLSKSGKSIIALPATAKGGTQSRIKFSVSYVTSLKSDVHYVVTEYGIASLFGKSIKQRAEELLAVAHPDFREQLKYEVEKI